MPHPQLVPIEQAIASIPGDACLALGGFDIVRAPMALVFELASRFIWNGPGKGASTSTVNATSINRQELDALERLDPEGRRSRFLG